ncbi:MAG: amidohydrolase family protein [Verrucomicrobiota bacterium]
MNNDRSGKIEDCIVLLGRELTPVLCSSFEYENGFITSISVVGESPTPIGDRPVVVPGFVNGHTHVGDCFLADAATNLTLAEGFFRPNGFKYRSLAKVPTEEHITAIENFLTGMAASGTIGHIDFREQGTEGCSRLRTASNRTGVRSVILSQFDKIPFTEDELEANRSNLPPGSFQELENFLSVSDGFSESTMNDLTDAAWKEIHQKSRSAGKRRAIHCLEDETYRSTSLERTGIGDLTRAIDYLSPDLIVHLTVATEKEIDEIAAAGIPAAVNPRANATLGLPLPPVARLLDAGIPVLLGTDNGMLNGPSLFPELDFTYRLVRSQTGNQNLIDPSLILKMVTTNPGATCWGDWFPGYLETGKTASFVEFDFSSPLLRTSHHPVATIVTRCQPSDIVQTVRDGHVIHHRD